MDRREEAKLRLGRGVWLAVGSFLAFAVMIWLGALSNVFSLTVMTSLAIFAFARSVSDTVGGLLGLLWSHPEPPLVTLPRARVVGPS